MTLDSIRNSCDFYIHNVLLQLWINSRGLTISVDDDSPLSVSINDPKVVKIIIMMNVQLCEMMKWVIVMMIMIIIFVVMQVFDGDGHGGGHGLCLQASFDEFPYYYHRSHSITCDELCICLFVSCVSSFRLHCSRVSGWLP